MSIASDLYLFELCLIHVCSFSLSNLNDVYMIQLQTFVEVNVSFYWPVKYYWRNPKAEVIFTNTKACNCFITHYNALWRHPVNITSTRWVLSFSTSRNLSIRCSGLVLVTVCWTDESSGREHEVNLSKWTSTVQ